MASRLGGRSTGYAITRSTMIMLAAKTILQAKERQLRIATAESCTGGMISAALTDVSGASDVFMCGFVTYSNEAKIKHLGVPALLLAEYGAVSREVAIAMAEGARIAANVDITVAVTGIAGPTGATADKPLGRVHIAVSRKHFPVWHQVYTFTGNRAKVRTQARDAALNLLLEGVSA
jgi:nicotinamide-nucleotide amidase